MKLSKWVLTSSVTVSIISATYPAFASVQLKDQRSGPVTVAGAPWQNVPYVTAKNTTFFGIWYLQQLLKQYGIQSTWNGQVLSVSNFPILNNTARLSWQGQVTLSSSATLEYRGTPYVNVSRLADYMGDQVGYDATHNMLTVDSSIPTTSPSISNSRYTSSFRALTQSRTLTAKRSMSTVHLATAQAPVTAAGAKVVEQTKLWKQVPILHASQTTFFGVWYLQQYLRAHGIQSDWNGRKLSIQAMPTVYAKATLQAGNTAQKMTLVKSGGDWFIPVSGLQLLGLQARVNASTGDIDVTDMKSPAGDTISGSLVDTSGHPVAGEVALQQANGHVDVVATTANGQFDAYLNSPSGALIGVHTQSAGWVGEAYPIHGSVTGIQPSATQGMTTITGQIQYPGSAYGVTQVSLRNVITHAHYYANVGHTGGFTIQVPVGAYEVFALMTNTDAVYTLQRFLAQPNTTELTVEAPSLPTGNQIVTKHATVKAGDTLVTADELESVARIFEHVYKETVTDMGMHTKGPVTITLYGTQSSYQKHFSGEGFSPTDAQQISESAIATEEGTGTISILMPTFDTVDGLNILAHEFTHALIAGTAVNIKSWANEGIAWTEGVRGEMDQSPAMQLKRSIQWNEWVDIVAHQKQNTLIPLGGGSVFSGKYNIEAQDYFAVQQLFHQFGRAKFLAYVRAIDADPNAFQDTFGESFKAFSKQVTQQLKNVAGQTDTGITVRLRVLPNGPQQIYVLNPAGKRIEISGLKPNMTYSIVCHQDGTVQVPKGLTTSAGSDLRAATQGDWYVGLMSKGDISRQEFDIVNQFATPFVAAAILYDNQGQINHYYPALALPGGIQLVSILANH